MIENADFADGGPLPGVALRWALRTHVAREAIAAFDRPAHGEESFEGWGTFASDFDPLALDRVFFGLEGTDDFDWVLRTFVDLLEPTMTVAALFGASTDERFAWSSLVDDWSASVLAGRFADDVEHHWRNDLFVTELDAAHVAPALFDLGAAETFDVGWPALTRI